MAATDFDKLLHHLTIILYASIYSPLAFIYIMCVSSTTKGRFEFWQVGPNALFVSVTGGQEKIPGRPNHTAVKQPWRLKMGWDTSRISKRGRVLHSGVVYRETRISLLGSRCVGTGTPNTDPPGNKCHHTNPGEWNLLYLYIFKLLWFFLCHSD